VTLAEHPALNRIAALAILLVLVALFCVGPLAAYFGLLADNNDALATKSAVLQRYRALAGAATGASVPSGPALLYPEMTESQASALLQEAVKNAATAARIQVQGLQVLRSDVIGGATRIAVRVRGSGDTASLRNFIYAIESARPLLYPDNLSIQSHQTGSDATSAALDFQVDVSGFKTEPQ
jgi:general secretion pathway protein M